jgi:Lhr-like helicase
LAGVKFPEFPEGKTLVGFLIITHSSTFTGGTTALDTATTVYVSPVGAFDPNILL